MNTDALRTQLVKKLQELFQMDQPDLDFGFYRVMHAKAAEISRFIDHDLLDTIKTAFDSAASAEAQETFAAARTKVVENFGASALDEHDNLQPAFAQTPAGKAYVEAQAKLNSAKDALTGEDSVYYHLYRFFSRYYDNGDFVSMRYHTRETAGMAKPYAIPYGGEEVMLHWANADQYYIKTAENFANYAFDLAKSKVFAGELVQTANTPLVVRFLVVEAQEGEHGNIKADAQKERKFFLAPEDPVQLNDAGELEIRFEYRQAADDDKVDEATAERIKAQYGASRKGDIPLLVLTDRIMSALKQYQATYTGIRAAKLTAFAEGLGHAAPTDSIRKRILLTRYLAQYTARNTADYFIHKDLRSFLRREMDFYIKNEIMNLDEVELAQSSSVENTLLLLKVFRKIAGKLIDFLGQLEDFQKKLWLKKKFVVQCDYCITLDRVPEEFYPEIAENCRQWQAWAKAGLLIVEFDNGYTEKNMPKQPKDITVFFADQPKKGYAYTFDHSGRWIDNSELEEVRASGKFGFSTVIDAKELFAGRKSLMVDTQFFPEEFKYRLLAKIDNFDEQCDGLLVHSENFQALNLLQERYRGQVKCTYIDPPYNAKSSEILYKNTYKHSSWLSLMYERLNMSLHLHKHDFTYFVAIDEIEQEVLGQALNLVFPNNKKVCVSIVHNPRGQQGKNISYTHEFVYIIYPSDTEKYLSDVKRAEIDSRNLRDSGTESDRTDGATCFYPFIVKDNEIMEIGEVPEDDYHPDSNNVLRKDGCMEIWPIDDDGHEKKWRYSVSSISLIRDKLKVEKGRVAFQIIFNQDMGTMRSLWANAKYDASEYGTKLLQSILGIEYVAKYAPKLYPKSINTETECISIGCNGDKNAIIVDFFAGSGTTGHAVINLNRADLGKRKYILVEMGDHFDTVLKPRIEKVVFSPDWKDGRPTSFDKGVSHCFKYLRLESYEDALNNLVVPEASAAPQDSPALREEYMLHYMLDTETRESLLQIKDFKQPFGHYRMQIKQPGSEAGELRSVDLQETFNYLLGLRVEHYYRKQGYQAAFKRSPDPELPASAQGQRTRLELDGRPELDDRGPWQFRKIEGWIPADLRNPNDGRKKRVLIIWRTLTDQLEQDNLMLDWYIGDTINLNEKHPEYDVIYVNGSNNLGADRKETDTYQVHLIEEEFLKQMWSGETV